MRVNEDYQTWNVVTEMGDSSSVLSFYKSALKLRKSNTIFVRDLRLLACEEIIMYSPDLR